VGGVEEIKQTLINFSTPENNLREAYLKNNQFGYYLASARAERTLGCVSPAPQGDAGGPPFLRGALPNDPLSTLLREVFFGGGREGGGV
jgi:hypothetical protein